MPKQGSSTEIKRQLDAIVSAAKALEATVHDMAQSAAAPAPAQAHLPRAMDEAAAAAATLDLSEGQRRICERVINVFETGTLEGKYGAISIFHDGPGQIRQITYGRSQTTEYGNLRELVQMYADANGPFSARLRPFIDKSAGRRSSTTTRSRTCCAAPATKTRSCARPRTSSSSAATFSRR